jgi:hypothetical protein
MEQPVRRVFAIEISRDFAAEKSARHRMCRIAAELRAAACLIDVYQQRTGVRAIERANGMAGFTHLELLQPEDEIVTAQRQKGQ